MRWVKLGQVFKLPPQQNWMHSHAQVPFTLIFDDFVRVFFSTRSSADKDGMFRSYSAFVDLDPSDGWKQLRVSNEPLLPLGGKGEFDEFGCMAGSIVRYQNRFLLYYCGWQRLQSVPYNWSIGVAESEDGEHFSRKFDAPIITGRPREPYLHACPIVSYSDAKSELEMYYLSGDRWVTDENEKMESVYTLKKCKSLNGITWSTGDGPILKSVQKDECQTSASVFDFNGQKHMIFSYRSGLGFRQNKKDAYKLGLAKADDSGAWERVTNNLQMTDQHSSAWDDQMVAYPHVFEFKKTTYMLYCGNDFGKGGFGAAVLES